MSVGLEDVVLPASVSAAVGLRLVDVNDVGRDIVHVKPRVPVPENGGRLMVGLLVVTGPTQVVGVGRSLGGATWADAVDVAPVQVDLPLPLLRQLNLLFPLPGLGFLVFLKATAGLLEIR